LTGALGCSASEDKRPASGNNGGSTGTGAPGTSSDPFGNTPGGTTAPGATGNPGMLPGAAGSGSPTGMPTTCAEGMQNTSPVTPNVWLIIDGSTSMEEIFDGPTRWQALRSALMDPGGLVQTLEATVRFGMVIYSGPMNGGGAANCANLVTAPPMLDNYANLSAMYPAVQIGGWTPTDRAIEQVVATQPVTNMQVLDETLDPTYVILATDGAPNDNCDGGGLGGGQGPSAFDPVVAQRVLDATTQGVAAGMKMFVISLAGMDQTLGQHLAEVAMIGSPGVPPFAPATRDELVGTLREIINQATCQVALNGTVRAGQECSGEVTLNGWTIDCNDPNGWSMANERTVQLTGTACDQFLGGPSSVRAVFPCGVFIPD
jgi:hypothetical protein